MRDLDHEPVERAGREFRAGPRRRLAAAFAVLFWAGFAALWLAVAAIGRAGLSGWMPAWLAVAGTGLVFEGLRLRSTRRPLARTDSAALHLARLRGGERAIAWSRLEAVYPGRGSRPRHLFLRYRDQDGRRRRAVIWLAELTDPGGLLEVIAALAPPPALDPRLRGPERAGGRGSGGRSRSGTSR